MSPEMGRLRYPMTISIVKIYVPLWRGFPLLYIFRTTTLVVYSRFHHVTTGFSLTTLTLTKMASKPSQKIALITGITGQVYITILDMLIVFSDFLTIFSFTYLLQISLWVTGEEKCLGVAVDIGFCFFFVMTCQVHFICRWSNPSRMAYRVWQNCIVE